MPANAIVFEKMLMPWGWRGGIGTTGIDLLLTYVAGVKRYCRTYCYHRYRSWCRRRVHVYVRVCYYKKWKDRDIPIWLNRSSRHCITLNIDIKMWIVKGALSRYFKLFWASTELPLNWRKPENNTLQREKNIKEIIINHKGARMVKDGEDWHGLQITKLKSLAKLLKPFNRDWVPLNWKMISNAYSVVSRVC